MDPFNRLLAGPISVANNRTQLDRGSALALVSKQKLATGVKR